MIVNYNQTVKMKNSMLCLMRIHRIRRQSLRLRHWDASATALHQNQEELNLKVCIFQ